MQSIVDRTGKKYNHLTLLYKIRSRGGGKGVLWMAMCDCGKTKEVDGRWVAAGKIKTCGKCEYTRDLMAYKGVRGMGIKAAESLLYWRYKSGATKRGLVFELDSAQFLNLIHKNCMYCNKLPSQKIKDSKLRYNGIDRLDNDKGYTLDNCVSCCGRCNKMKGTINYLDFLDHIVNVYKNMEKLLSDKPEELQGESK